MDMCRWLGLGERAGRQLVVLSVLACTLLTFRVAFTGEIRFGFLVWNLFLAWIPFWIALAIERLAIRTQPGSGTLLIPVALWALFLPNAPYILTDIVHLRRSSMAMLPWDTLLILSFALPALALGLLSLARIHRLVETRVGQAAGWVFVATMLLLTGTGMWLGRVVRLNSWDAILRPGASIERTLEALGAPGGRFTAVGFTVAFGALLLGTYLMSVAHTRRRIRSR